MEPHAPTHFPPMAAPPPPGALTRVMRIIRGITLPTIAISGLLIAGETIMPPSLKPSDWIGSFHGNIEAADANAKREALVELARRQAEEVAREQGKVQMELAILQQQMLTLHESMTGLSDQANVADWVCIAGRLMSGTSNRDARDWGRTMAGACGYSDSVREQQQAQYQALSRKYAALMVRNDELHRQQVEFRAKAR